MLGDDILIKKYNSIYFVTAVDNNFLSFAVIVSCDTPVDKRYCYTDEKEVMFTKDNVEVINEAN